jgi:tetratricopeptide (TPR) repeat protein
LILPIVLLSAPAGAQFGARERLSGLIAPTPPRADTLQVEASNQETHFISARASVHYDGTFEFTHLESGHYEFRLTTQTGNVLASTMGSIPSQSEIRFELPPSPRPQGPVSIYRLTHHPPRKAVKALRQAADAFHQGRPEVAAQRVDSALAADPDFAVALHLRGVLALKAGDFPRALQDLRRAAILDNANPVFLANSAVALYICRDPSEARRLAQASLRLNPEQSTARMVLDKLGAQR